MTQSASKQVCRSGCVLPLFERRETMRRLFKAILLAAFIGGSETSAETLKIATYNVENYVATNRMTEDGYRLDYPKPEKQKAALRNVIRSLNADILVLQEMGGSAYLEELRRDLKSSGIDYPHAVLLLGPDPDRHVALLSKRAIAKSQQHTDLRFDYFKQTERLKRGLLEVQFETAAGPLTLFAAHFKSRFTDRADDPRSELRREAEAVAVRNLVLVRFPNPALDQFIILGDFNDDRSSKTLQRLLKRGSTRIGNLVPVVDSRGESWTHAYRKQDSYTRVDHILLSPALSARFVEGSGIIFDGPGVTEASDHRPVSVTLEFVQIKKAGLATGLEKGHEN
jgi:endonuclease/exonuclease/phosphatase family metal-dependent hydrolase